MHRVAFSAAGFLHAELRSEVSKQREQCAKTSPINPVAAPRSERGLEAAEDRLLPPSSPPDFGLIGPRPAHHAAPALFYTL